MSSTQTQPTNEETGAFWRRMRMAEEDRLAYLPGTVRPGAYRWFRSENVAAIEHFRRPHAPGQKAGRFGWLPSSGEVRYEIHRTIQTTN
jgi:hypothetical protein